MHKSEQDAARQYDRALIIVKGRLAKTNFPMTDYEAEVKTFEAYLLSRHGFALLEASMPVVQEAGTAENHHEP